MAAKANNAKPLIQVAKAHDYIAWYPQGEYYVNLSGEYDYMEAPYYISHDYEMTTRRVHPTCMEMLDAYVTPLMLEKAKLAGLPVPEWYITNGYFEPPVVVDPVNPFMTHSRTVLKPVRRESIARSMTRNFTYAICCQDIPPGGRIRRFHEVLGWTAAPKYRPLAGLIWALFRIPLATVRVITLPGGETLLSDLSQLPFEKLGDLELHQVRSNVTWEI